MKNDKTVLKLILSVVLFFAGIVIYSQGTGCTVKMESISGSYKGKCKKGLARGKGSAEGTDRYSGSFRKGLPHGTGTYTWANGDYFTGEWRFGLKEGEGKLVSGDSIVEGVWKEDSYLGKKLIAPYKINRSMYVTRSSFKKSNSTFNEVIVKLIRGGIENSGVENFMIAYTSGTQYKAGHHTGIQNPSFPLDVKVTFSALNIFRTARSEVVFDFTVNQPGRWEVTISY